jgi:DNA helicase-2/ATP-dependent DNA helicase PcrA
MTKEVFASPQQEAIFDFVKTGTGNALLRAVAGSGKTWTLVQLLQFLDGQVALAAYNTAIAKELEDKVSKIENLKPKVSVGTCHRFGRQALVKKFPKAKLPGRDDRSKIDVLMEEIVHPKTHQKGVPDELKSFVRKAYELARQSGAGVLPEFPFTKQDAWLELVDHFDLMDEFANSEGDLPLDIDQLVGQGCNWTVYIIKYGIQRCEDIIDFGDMIYVPLYLNLRFWTYNWVLVDEVQDINPTRRAIIKKMLAPGGRAIFVGDDRQAIYGFTGADAKSFENIRKEFNCKDLDLTWSFRCPKSVVRFVKQWVNHIESTPDALEGEVLTIDEKDFWNQMDQLSITDAILCRNNAPLCTLFFDLLMRGIPSHIEGRDLSGKLLKLINRWSKIKTLTSLENKLFVYKEKEIQKGMQSGKEQKASEIADTVDSIMAIISGLPLGSSVDDLRNKITSMFQDTNGDKSKTLTLTTIHKSKGREWNKVYWYGRNRYNPSPYARQDWQVLQEQNLMYVAGTRAKMTLVEIIVPIPPPKRW